MDIGRRINIGSVEKHLKKLEGTHDTISIRVPSNASQMSLGGEISFAQLLVTWAQRDKLRRIETYAKNCEDKQLTHLSRKLYGLVAGLVSTSVLNSSRDIELRECYESLTLSRLDELQTTQARQASRGAQLEILCADHVGRSTPLKFYYPEINGSGFRARADFNSLAQEILEVISFETRSETKVALIKLIGELVYELVKNTHDHARFSLDRDSLPISIRGMQARSHALNDDALKAIGENFAPLSDYLARFSTPNRSLRNFVELSFIDSGPGLAQTWTGKKLETLNIEKELAAVNECFSIGTSKSHRSAGFGLPRVAALLNNSKGFLRLRTGRLSLFYDFAKTPLKLDSSSVTLDTWSDGYKMLPKVEGALITLLLPTESEA